MYDEATKAARYQALAHALGRAPTQEEFNAALGGESFGAQAGGAGLSAPAPGAPDGARWLRAVEAFEAERAAERARADHWTTQKGVTYNATHLRPSKVPLPVGYVFDTSKGEGPMPALAAKQAKALEKASKTNAVEDLGGDDRPNDAATIAADAAKAKAMGLPAAAGGVTSLPAKQAKAMEKASKAKTATPNEPGNLSAYQNAVMGGMSPEEAAKKYGVHYGAPVVVVPAPAPVAAPPPLAGPVAQTPGDINSPDPTEQMKAEAWTYIHGGKPTKKVGTMYGPGAMPVQPDYVSKIYGPPGK